jgi:hypothetical protein
MTREILQVMGEEHGTNGHVGILSFETEKELMEYFEKTGEELSAHECGEVSLQLLQAAGKACEGLKGREP